MYNKKYIKLNYHGPYEMGSWDFKDTKIGSHNVSFKDNEEYKKFIEYISNSISKFNDSIYLKEEERERKKRGVKFVRCGRIRRPFL